MSLAFCFLLKESVKHGEIWEEFFKGDSKNTHNIYSHVKEVTKDTQDWIKENKIKTMKTGWCEENLVYVWIKLLKEAIKNKKNKYFMILSDECIPLYTYNQIYKKITSSSKSCINIEDDATASQKTGLYYASQWCILNRKHAKTLIDFKETDEGREIRDRMRKRLCDVYSPFSEDQDCFCPDEIYPINWFVYKYDSNGEAYSEEFKSEFKIGPTTYVTWGDGTSPDILTLSEMSKIKKKICKSGSLFARKFDKKAAQKLAMSCGKNKSKSK